MCNVSSVKSRVPGLSLGYVQAAAWVRTVQTVKLTDLHFSAPPSPLRCLDWLARLQKALECTDTG